MNLFGDPLGALIISTITCGAIGYWIGSKIDLYAKKKKIKEARDNQYGELKKMADFINHRGKILTNELTDFVTFVNNDLPSEITNIILAEPKLTILKEKGDIPDKDYMEALSPVIVNTQTVIAQRLQVTLDNIIAETVKDMKGLMNEPIQEK